MAAHRIAEVEIKKRVSSLPILAAFESFLLTRRGVQALGCAVQRDVFVDQDGLINASEPKWSVFRLRTATSVGRRSDVPSASCGNVVPKVGQALAVKYVATIKSPTVIVNGIATTDEDEITLPSEVALSLLSDPNKGLAIYQLPFLDRVVTRFSLNPERGVSKTGEYTTIRSKYQMDIWTGPILAAKGVNETPILELDETVYEFGSAFEVEVETSCPEYVETLLIDLLRESGCTEGISNSLKSKYTNYLAGNIDGKAAIA